MLNLSSINSQFIEKIGDNDMIFHYTKSSTAIDYILKNNNLRFNSIRNSSDPIERIRANRSIVNNTPSTFENRMKDVEAAELVNYVGDLEDRFSIVCFCKNINRLEKHNFSPPFEGYEEDFGFTRVRMWDQYADRYSGVCIAFSKEKVLFLNQHLNLLYKDVDYLNISELQTRKVPNIQVDYLFKVDVSVYKSEIDEQLRESSFFCKNVDYSGENEFRIGTLFDREKAVYERKRDEISITQTTMLDITDCIEAIFVTNFINAKDLESLHIYSKKFNVKLIQMYWSHDSFDLIDYVENERILNGIIG